MAKNSIDAYGAAGKTNLLFFRPEDLVLVTDETSALYDDRVHLPVRENMVLNIMAQGVIQPITVRKNPESGFVEVVTGRQRVKNAREANMRLVAQGLEPVQVAAWAKRDDAVTLAGHTVSENELREADTPMGRARKMASLMGRGKTEADLAILFGCNVATIKSSLALLECSAAVRNAVEAGKINVGHALKLAKLAPDEQRVKVAELVEAGEGVTGHAKARAQRAVVEDAGPRMRSKKHIQERLAASTDEGDQHVLRWVLGEGPL